VDEEGVGAGGGVGRRWLAPPAGRNVAAGLAGCPLSWRVLIPGVREADIRDNPLERRRIDIRLNSNR
jgi:hypothetical protein